MEAKFNNLRSAVQEIIDLVAAKRYQEAIEKHASTNEELDEMIDHSDDDADLRELSRYQVLLNRLHEKIYKT
jgi:F0F1-type ATP synthase membrane subunit b/b'